MLILLHEKFSFNYYKEICNRSTENKDKNKINTYILVQSINKFFTKELQWIYESRALLAVPLVYLSLQMKLFHF